MLNRAPTPPWSFFDFVYLSGGTPIQDWYDALSDHGQLLVNGLIKINRNIENPVNWQRWKKYMGGELKGHKIWQLEFFSEGRQHRLLGVFDGAKRAIFIMGYYHKGKIYTPPDALETALKRKKLVERRECILNERKVKVSQ